MTDWLPDIVKNLGVLMMLAVGIAYIQTVALDKATRFRRDFLSGILFGIVIIVVMLSPISLPAGATFDPRAGPAILAGVFAGPAGGVIAAALGAFGRYYLVGGPVALGGSVGFVLYGLFGIGAGILIRRYGHPLTPLNLLLLSIAGTIAVLPAFFVSADVPTAIAILKKAGALFLLQNVASTLIVGLAIDYANQFARLRNALIERQQEDAKLSLVARSTTNAVVITDAGGHVEWVNEAFTRLTGYELEEIAGKKPGSFLQGRDSDPATVAHMHDCLEAKQPFDVEIINYTKANEPFWLRIHCQPVEEEDEPLRFIAIESNVTKRKTAELLLEQSRQKLEAQLEQTQQANRRIEQQSKELVAHAEKEVELRVKAEAAEKAKSEFLASMSHEIRTPMTGVMGFADLLLEDDLPKESAEKVRQIKTATQSLLRIINDILDISKHDAGKLAFEPRAFRTRTVLEDVVSLFRTTRMAPVSGALEIGCRIDDAIPEYVIADPIRLRQILVNLVGNAVKFTEQGRVDLRCSLDPDASRLRFEICDTGIGVSEDALATLFDAFTQADSSLSRNYQGTGLGLSICKRLVELMGGEIGAESTVGVGSTFWFTLPFETASSADVEPAGPRPSVAEGGENAGLRILVAEDNEVNRTIIASILDSLGHDADMVENGREAVAAARDGHYDAVLMDIRMPVMSGLDATRAIRAGETPGQHVPIIALTADVVSENQETYFEAGMNACVAKPIERDELARTIQRVAAPPAAASRPAEAGRPAAADARYDYHEAVRRLGISGGLLDTLLHQFVENYHDAGRTIGDLVGEDKLDEALEVLHTVRGVSANLGAMALAETAAEVERRIRDSNKDSVVDALPVFASTLEQTIASMSRRNL
ncbi:ATP-binding protein [Nisaea sp.]|uniref:ATP-binding protein n=1 Tax=Nisaea sp. TaxID=2024842 RepID=UPI003B523B7C